MRAAKKHDEYTAAWDDFLHHASRVYDQMQRALKKCREGRALSDRLARDRKKDPLLKYIHEARNVEQHGIEPTVAEGWTIIPKGKVDLGTIELGPNMEPRVPNWRPMEPGAELVISHFRELIPLRNKRSGKSIDPPTIHLGKCIKGRSAFVVSEVAFHYLWDRMYEARDIALRLQQW